MDDGTRVIRERAKAVAKKATRKWSTQFESGNTGQYSDRAKQIASLAEKIGGCQTEPLMALLEILAAEKLPRFGNKGEGLWWAPAVCFVPNIKLRNQSFYRLEKGSVYTISGPTPGNNWGRNSVFGVDDGDVICSSLPSSSKSVRPATDEEIDRFFDDAGLGLCASLISFAESERRNDQLTSDGRQYTPLSTTPAGPHEVDDDA